VRRDADRERFPGLRDDLGEDPARFLDRPLFDGDEHTASPGAIMRARIRGIDYLATLRAWKAVERNLDRGPRDRVIEMLEDREQWLLEHGDRDERLPDEIERRDDDQEDVEPADVTPAVIHQSCGVQVDEVDGAAGGYRCPECEQLTRQVEVVEPDQADQPAVATDGGL
jgi:hypothetical protein